MCTFGNHIQSITRRDKKNNQRAVTHYKKDIFQQPPLLVFRKTPTFRHKSINRKCNSNYSYTNKGIHLINNKFSNCATTTHKTCHTQKEPSVLMDQTIAPPIMWCIPFSTSAAKAVTLVTQDRNDKNKKSTKPPLKACPEKVTVNTN